MSTMLTMARGGMETFVHGMGWSALVVAAGPLKKGWLFFTLVRVNDEAEATIKSPTRQIDRNFLTSTFQLAMVERVLGALDNAPGSCGEEEAVVGVLFSGGVISVGAGTTAALVLLRPTIGQAFGWKISCVWV